MYIHGYNKTLILYYKIHNNTILSEIKNENN